MQLTSGSELIPFHGDPTIKARAVDLMRNRERNPNPICESAFWMETPDGPRTSLGIPLNVYRMQAYFYRHLPEADKDGWPEAFLGTIEPGSDLSTIWNRYAIWCLSDPDFRSLMARLGYEEPREDVVLLAIAMHQRVIEDEPPTSDEWKRLRFAAFGWTGPDGSFLKGGESLPGATPPYLAMMWASPCGFEMPDGSPSAAVEAAWAMMTSIFLGLLRTAPVPVPVS